jgi:uncharacterized NAD(P)/FAD-binding protein YdhS
VFRYEYRACWPAWFGPYAAGRLGVPAIARPARVSRITSHVVAIRRGSRDRIWRLHLAADGRIDADVVVLATGNLPPGPPCPVPQDHRYIADPWEPGALAAAADGSPVAVLGTGLTMLDVAIALTDAHPRTAVHAISRHALLPREHHWPRPAVTVSPMPVVPRPGETLRLTALIRDIRACATAYPGDWQDIVDALRPQIPRLWAELPETDKQLFLRRLARHWEVHRHRVPPATARRIAALRSAGRLTVHRGHAAAAHAQRGGGIRVRVDHGGSATDLAAGWLINCTGAATDITTTADPLLQYLLVTGLARPDPLRLGLDADGHGALRDGGGRPVPGIFALGPLLRGRWFETTAIPEIRDQAATLARHLLATQAHASRGSAA